MNWTHEHNWTPWIKGFTDLMTRQCKTHWCHQIQQGNQLPETEFSRTFMH